METVSARKHWGNENLGEDSIICGRRLIAGWLEKPVEYAPDCEYEGTENGHGDGS